MSPKGAGNAILKALSRCERGSADAEDGAGHREALALPIVLGFRRAWKRKSRGRQCPRAARSDSESIFGHRWAMSCHFQGHTTLARSVQLLESASRIAISAQLTACRSPKWHGALEALHRFFLLRRQDASSKQLGMGLVRAVCQDR